MNNFFAVVLLSVAFSAPAAAQRVALSDRVTTLEQQTAKQVQATSQANIELLNKSTQMQDEIRSLRALIEQLQNELDQARQRNREQYIDLESRVSAIEKTLAVPATTSSTPTMPVVNLPAASPENSAYQNAYATLVKQGDAETASKLFQDFLRTYPESKLVPNAWYWLGESYYISKNFSLALKSFEIIKQRFPDSSKVADASLKAAFCKLELKQIVEGKAALDEVIRVYPNHPVAEMAKSRLRGLNVSQ